MNNAASGQKFIARNRAPRVQIEYDVELYGSERKVELPFVMGVMADLVGQSVQPLPRIDERKFLDVDMDNINDRMKSFNPGVNIRVNNTLAGEGELPITLSFNHIDDFLPDAIANQVEPLSRLLQARIQLSNLLAYMDGKHGAEELIATLLADRGLQKLIADQAGTECPQPDALRQFNDTLYEQFRPKTEQARSAVETAITILAQQALENNSPLVNTAFSAIQALISALDGRLSGQINLILHHPEVQKLEGTWRGLHYLVNNTESSEMLKIRVLNIGKQELGQTLKRYKGASWDQSPIFKRVYEEEYGQFGGEPLGCLIGDYYFDHSPQDAELLGEMAKIAAAAHCPFISGASPSVMQMESWQELSNPRDLTKIFLNTEYAAWRILRESEDARYLGLVMPRLLARLPYGIHTHPVASFLFE